MVKIKKWGKRGFKGFPLIVFYGWPLIGPVCWRLELYL